MKIDTVKHSYNIRLGKFREGTIQKSLKAELEKKAFEKDMKLPELMRKILIHYIKKCPPKE